jgi:hypothetical protein
MAGNPHQAADVAELYVERMRSLASDYAAGRLSLAEFDQGMHDAIRQAHILMAMAGVDGDTAAIPAGFWAQLADELGTQNDFLDRFIADIQSGSLSDDELAARAALYARSARQEYAKTAAQDLTLPAYPGDGSSPCLGNCGCSWDEREDGWYWVRGKNDSCEECIRRERDWSPYRGGDNGDS